MAASLQNSSCHNPGIAHLIRWSFTVRRSSTFAQATSIHITLISLALNTLGHLELPYSIPVAVTSRTHPAMLVTLTGIPDHIRPASSLNPSIYDPFKASTFLTELSAERSSCSSLISTARRSIIRGSFLTHVTRWPNCAIAKYAGAGQTGRVTCIQALPTICLSGEILQATSRKLTILAAYEAVIGAVCTW